MTNCLHHLSQFRNTLKRLPTTSFQYQYQSKLFKRTSLSPISTINSLALFQSHIIYNYSSSASSVLQQHNYMGLPETQTMSTTSTVASTKSDKDKFLATFDDVVKLLMDDLSNTFDLSEDNLAYLRKVICYNVPHGKLNRGLAVYQCFKEFHISKQDTKEITEKQIYEANVLGWCVELLQAFFLVADDIMDDSYTRRGQPCFFRLPEIGLNAVNDSIILESMIYRLLKLVFIDHEAYIHLNSLFQEIAYTTEIGQMLDLTSSDQDQIDISQFNEKVLSRIYKYKTSHYTFYLPVALGMRLAGVDNLKHYEKAKSICLKMGYYFQAQDDYLDAFGDPQVTGKVGTDIEDNTCTWLIVQALQICSDDQRVILQQNYGKKDKPEYANRVKEMYKQLDLLEKFKQFELDSYRSLRSMIDEVDDMPTGAFEFLLSKIYKRDK